MFGLTPPSASPHPLWPPQHRGCRLVGDLSSAVVTFTVQFHVEGAAAKILPQKCGAATVGVAK